VHFVLPGDVDDRTAPSGGNTYGNRVCRELPAAGWAVRRHLVRGGRPHSAAAREELAEILGGLPDGSVVLLDGLVACAAPDVLAAQAGRLAPAVLVHLPLADETGLAPGRAAELDALERRALHAVPAVIATSDWAAGRLVAHHALDPARVHVAVPGVDPAPLAPGTDGATRLLCVASVTPRKGQRRLVRALAPLTDRTWTCEFVGGVDRDPGYVAQLRREITRSGLADRIRLTGPLTGAALDARYATADLMVLASCAETYGMVVTEALARGIPVLATAVDGVPEAVGRAADGTVPGLLVSARETAALTGALHDWLADRELRRGLKKSAQGRRAMLEGWEMTSRNLARVLERLRHEPRRAV
jgi:glycosyltransferase involved in cell wall biosynthesis